MTTMIKIPFALLRTGVKSLFGITALLFCFQAFPVSAERVISSWSSIWEGVDYATGYSTTPGPVKVYAMRVDLKNPAVGMHATPGNGGAPLETTMQTTPAYANTYSTIKAAINANFFSASGGNADNRGVLISSGSTVSPHEGAFPTQLRITSGLIASIVAGGITPTGIHTAVSGDAFMLNGGLHFGENSTLNPHTAVGLSENKRFLYLLVVDGRQPGWSDGCTIWQLGYWLSDFGAWWGMNLDGGGSTCMVSKYGSSALVLNRPSDGSSRSIGANLGVITGNYDPRMDVVVRSPSGNISKKHWRQSSGWSGWLDYGAPAGGTTSDPSIVARGPGRLDIFVRGGNGQVYRKYYYNTWSSWASIGSQTIVGAPDACAWDVDRMDVFARSANNTLLHATWDGSTWSAWQDLGGSIASDPTAVSWGPGRLDVFARGTAGDLQHIRAIEGQGYSLWESLGGTLNGGPDACSTSDGRLHVFYRASNNSMRWRSYVSGGSWSAETNLSGTHYSDPGVVSRGPGHLEVFSQKTGNILTHNYYTSGGGWSGWNDISGTVLGGPDACSWSNDSGKH